MMCGMDFCEILSRGYGEWKICITGEGDKDGKGLKMEGSL